MAQVTGRVYITVKGRRLASKEGAKLKMGGVDRETVLADTGPVGFSEKTVAPGVECTIPHTADVKLQDFQDMTDVSISFDADTGRSFVLNNAWLTKALEMSKGEVALAFDALSCVEV